MVFTPDLSELLPGWEVVIADLWLPVFEETRTEGSHQMPHNSATAQACRKAG